MSRLQSLWGLFLLVDAIEQSHIAYVKEWIASGAELFRTAKPATPDKHLVSYFVPFVVRVDSLKELKFDPVEFHSVA